MIQALTFKIRKNPKNSKQENRHYAYVLNTCLHSFLMGTFGVVASNIFNATPMHLISIEMSEQNNISVNVFII